jgi:hypothetical protein
MIFALKLFESTISATIFVIEKIYSQIAFSRMLSCKQLLRLKESFNGDLFGRIQC